MSDQTAPETSTQAANGGEPSQRASRTAGSGSDSEATAEKLDIVIQVFGKTDVGQVREHNEDNFIVADLTRASRSLLEGDRQRVVGERGALLGVCDGMGGAAAGEV